MKSYKIALIVFLLISFFIPTYASDVTILSFEKDPSEDTDVFTADKTKVFGAAFLAEKNSTKEVPVFITNVINLSNTSLFIEYDKNVIIPEDILNGDFNVSYVIGDDIEINLDLNESFTGDLLLANILFRAVGNEGESSSLTIEVDSLMDTNSEEIFYVTFEGVFNINIKEEEEEMDSEGDDKLGGDLGGLVNAENRSKFAEENNLDVEDNKVRVIIQTNNTTEDKFVDIDDLLDLANNETIKNIKAYKQIPEKLLVIVIIFVVATVLLLKFLKRK